MKASDVRIGNWVNTLANWNDGKEYFEECQVTEISEEVFTWATGIDGSYQTTHKPIPLTEEWLLKFGFNKTITKMGGFLYKKKIYKNYSKLVVCDFGAGLSVDLTTDSGSLFVIGEIDFIHQLQNLYFALTGEELEISE